MKKRYTARLILLNSNNQIYLMKIKPNNVSEKNAELGQSFWVTIGGEIEHAESVEDALKRELYEETGITDAKICQPAAWNGEIILTCDGKDVLFCESFFVAHVDSNEISHQGLLEHERDVLCDHRWWSMDELKKSTELFVPKNLFELLNEIIINGCDSITTRVINLSLK